MTEVPGGEGETAPPKPSVRKLTVAERAALRAAEAEQSAQTTPHSPAAARSSPAAVAVTAAKSEMSPQVRWLLSAAGVVVLALGGLCAVGGLMSGAGKKVRQEQTARDAANPEVRAAQIIHAIGLCANWRPGQSLAYLRDDAAFDEQVASPAMGSTWYDVKDEPRTVRQVIHTPQGYDVVYLTGSDAPVPAPFFVRMFTRERDPEAKAHFHRLVDAMPSVPVERGR